MLHRYQLIDGVLVPIISGGIDDGGDPPAPDENALDADLEAAAAAQLGSPAATPTNDDAEPSGEGSEPSGGEEGAEGGDVEGAPSSAPSGDEPPEPTEPTMLDLGDGVQITLDEARTLQGFGQFLRENPEIAGRVAAVLEGGDEASGTHTAPTRAPVPTGFTPPEPPEGIDLDDPAIAALWNQHVDTLAAQTRMEEMLRQHDDWINRSSRETLQSLTQEARQSYQTEHNLSDAEMAKVYEVAGSLQVLPSLMQPTDPITGVPRAVDPMAAIKQSFEIARWQIPELREREVQLLVEQRKPEEQRKKKLSSLGGSGGTAPKTKPEPKTEADRRAAMIEQVAAYQRGEGELA